MGDWIIMIWFTIGLRVGFGCRMDQEYIDQEDHRIEWVIRWRLFRLLMIKVE